MIPSKRNAVWKRILISVFAGVLISSACGAGSYVFPLFDAFSIYISPSRFLLPVIGPLVPSALVDRLVPEGGAPAGVLLIVICAALFWAIIFALLYFVWTSIKRARANSHRS